MTSNILSLFSGRAAQEGQVIVNKHPVIDRVRDILEKNRGKYVPGDKAILEGIRAGENPISGEKGYVLDVSKLDIIYDITNDKIGIQHSPEVMEFGTGRELYVGQANMVLLTSGLAETVEVLLAMEGKSGKDKLVILEASKILD